MTSDQGEAWVVTRGKWVVMTRGIGSDQVEVGNGVLGNQTNLQGNLIMCQEIDIFIRLACIRLTSWM